MVVATLPFFCDDAGTPARLRGMLPRDGPALGLPILETVPKKRKGAGGVGAQNGSQPDSGNDAHVDAVALGDNELCYVASKSDGDNCILVG